MAPKLEAKCRVAAQIKAKSVTSAKPAKRLKKLNPPVSPPSSPAASPSPPCQDIEAVVPVSFSQAEVDEARQKLLAWYDVNHRILPWRRNSSSQRPVDGTEEGGAPPELPQQQFIYFVWVSEVMSQQTQVPRAAEYFRRWVAKWPTVANLAAATEGEVNEMWAGLGYYRRARFLLAGAHYIVNDCDGVFPTTAFELKKIPGVGAYTGNAIASIACHEAVAVVDANVVRVVSRLRKLADDPRTKASVMNQTAGADALLDPQRPGDFNQAVMELGATVCTVHQPPSCASCPLRSVCQAYADVLRSPASAVPVTSYPAKVEKAKKREETAAVAVLELMLPGGPSRSKFLLLQRPKDGLLAGLWEFPLKLVDTDASRSQCKQQIEELLEGVLGQGLAAEHVVERRMLGEITHIFTHIRLTMHVEHIKIKGAFSTDDREAVEADGTAAVRWLSRVDVEAEGLSSGVRKVFDLASKAAKGEKQGIKRFFNKA